MAIHSAGYGGEVYAYNLTTGTLIWKAAIDNEGLESVYERAPLSSPCVVDGKVFVYTPRALMTQPITIEHGKCMPLTQKPVTAYGT
jgi:outer membrane protein assembly factor BamB